MIAPEGFAEHGPFDVILELVGAPNLAENLQALATGGRISIIGVGGRSEERAEPAGADGQARPHPRLDPAGQARWRRKRWPRAWSSTRCCRCSTAARCGCRSPRRFPWPRRRPPMTTSPAAASSARSSSRPSGLSRAAGRRTSRRARGRPTRTRALRPARRATRRCWGRTARRSCRVSCWISPSAGRSSCASGMFISPSAASASGPITTMILGCTIAISWTTRATQAKSASEASLSGHLTHSVPYTARGSIDRRFSDFISAPPARP